MAEPLALHEPEVESSGQFGFRELTVFWMDDNCISLLVKKTLICWCVACVRDLVYLQLLCDLWPWCPPFFFSSKNAKRYFTFLIRLPGNFVYDKPSKYSILRPETNSLTHHAQRPTLHRWHEKLLYCSKTWIQSPVLSGWRRSVNGYVWSHSGRTSAHWHNLRLLRVHMSLIHPSFYLLLAYTQQDSLPMLLIMTIFSTGSDKFSVIELPLARSIGLLLSCYYLCHFFWKDILPPVSSFRNHPDFPQNFITHVPNHARKFEGVPQCHRRG